MKASIQKGTFKQESRKDTKKSTRRTAASEGAEGESSFFPSQIAQFNFADTGEVDHGSGSQSFNVGVNDGPSVAAGPGMGNQFGQADSDPGFTGRKMSVDHGVQRDVSQIHDPDCQQGNGSRPPPGAKPSAENRPAFPGHAGS
jgi:hypothetical protein